MFNNSNSKKFNELCKLNVELNQEGNELRRELLKKRIALCEALNWKDYKLIYIEY